MSERSPAKKLGRAAAYPALRLLEPRFADLFKRLSDTRSAVESDGATTRAEIRGIEPIIANYAASTGESLAFVGAEMRELLDGVRAVNDLVARAEAGIAPAGGSSPGSVEEGFVFRALGGVAPPAPILDVCGATRTVGATLAALGHAVTCVDSRPYEHQHPGMTQVDGDLAEVDQPSEPFAGACWLSGVPVADHEDPWAAEIEVLRRIGDLLAGDGVVALAVPAGSGVGQGRVRYDDDRLDALLGDWRVVERWAIREPLPGTWIRAEQPEEGGVVLVAATPA